MEHNASTEYNSRKIDCRGGIDGSGKSTQIDLIHKWFSEKGRSVFFSEGNSSLLKKSTTKLGKKQKSFTTTTFSLI